MVVRSILLVLVVGVLCVAGLACSADRDPCEQVADRQEQLIAAAPELDRAQKADLRKEVRAARSQLVELCRDALARDGAAAQRALDCSLRATSLRAMRACPSSPTFVEGFAQLSLGRGRPTARDTSRDRPALPPTPAVITDVEPGPDVERARDDVADPLDP